MKKLMVALSAVALAFGVHAADGTIASENFNGSTDVPETITDAGGESTISTLPFSFSQKTNLGEPDEFRDGEAGNNLAVKTALAAPAYYEPTNMTSGVYMDGLYFDSLVKFTACDEDAAVPAGSDAKLMVWVKESEDQTKTNLMVTAGCLNSENVPTATIYDCGALSDYDVDGADDWCRLTIKAKADISDSEAELGVPGFVVFVNGKAATMAAFKQDGTAQDRTIGVSGSAVDHLSSINVIWEEAHQLFPSMIVQANKISSVGFAGQGAVDDLSFTTAEPTDASDNEFAKDPAVATVTWPKDGSLESVKINGKDMTVSAGSCTVAAGAVVTVEATPAENYMITGGTIGEWTPAAGAENEITTARIAATVEIDGESTPCASLEDAITKIEGASKDALLTLGGNSGAIVIDRSLAADSITVTIDLAGNTITPEEGDEWGIFVDGASVVVTDNSESVGTVNGGTAGSVASNVDAVLAAGIFKGTTVMVIGVVNGVKCDVDAKDSIDCLDDDQQWSEVDEDGLYTVIEKVIEKHSFILMIGAVEYFREQIEEGADIDVPDAPTSGLKGWQTFTQWQYQDGTPFVKTTMGTEDITLYAGTEFLDQDLDDNYLVQTEGDLIKLQAYVADGQDTTGKTFKLMDDINLGGVTWEGIGLANAKDYCTSDGKSFADFKAGAFAGTFDGDGNTIFGVTIKGGDYNGFFNSTYKAKITNLKLGIANNGVAETSASSDALFVGVAFDSELSNLEAVKGEDTGTTTFTTGKDAAIIVGYMAGGMVSNCVNNLNVQTSPTATDRKAGGIVLITQNSGTDKGSETASPALIVDCVNKGAIATSNQGTAGVAGILGYVGMATTLKNVVNNGNVSTTGGTAYSIFGNDAWKDKDDHSKGKWLLIIEGANEAQDTYMAGNTAIDGLNFATVDAGGVATFVKDAAVVEAAAAADATYKVMSPITTFAYQFTGDAGEIAFLTGLNDPTFTITDKSGNAVDPTVIEGGVKYVVTAAPVNPEVVPGGAPVEVTAESATDAESKVIVKATSPDAEVISNDDYAKYYKAKATLVEGNTYSVTVVLDPEKVEFPETEAAFDAEIGDFAADADATGITVTNAKPGLFYYVEEAQKLETGLAEADRDRAMAGKDGNVTVPMTKFDGSGFYQLKVSDIQKGVVR